MQLQLHKSLNMVRWILGIVRNLASITCEVRGLENIPKDRAVLYVGNHRSYFDIVMGYTTVPSPTGFLLPKRDDRHSSFKFVDGADELSVFGPRQYKGRFKDHSHRN